MFRHFLHRPLAIDSPSFIHGGMFLSPIGAGLVYEFQSRDGGITWEEVRLIFAANSGSFAAFGDALAIDGDVALIGSSGRTVAGNQNSGSAYVYNRVNVKNKPFVFPLTSGNSEEWECGCNCS
jgi:hypothetical protein